MQNTEIMQNAEKFAKNAVAALNLEKNKSFQTVSFEKTPLMSTYLLALVVGELEKLSKKDGRTEIYTPFDKKDATFALEIAEDSLNYFERFFGVKYPLKKLRHVAIPEFSMGAMENWGLVTYRTNALLTNSNTSIFAKRRVAETIAHEIAHQWFGNLVTMKWWDDLWLNEGFATFASFICLEEILKDKKYQETNSGNSDKDNLKITFQIFSDFISSQTDRGLSLDSKDSSHPIHIKVSEPEEIEQIFDSITYAKGASLIRMIYDFKGKDVFQKQLSEYLDKFKYSNASTSDLFKTLGGDIDTMMGNWTKEQGFPLLSVSLDEGKKNIVLEQNVFKNKTSKRDDNLIWNIPVKILYGDNTSKYEIITEKKKLIPLDSIFANYGNLNTNSSSIQNFIINTGKVGFYRVKYSKEVLELIIKSPYLKGDDLASFIDDQTALMISSNISVQDYLGLCIYSNSNLTSAISKDYYLASSMVSGLNYLKAVFYSKKDIVENINKMIKLVIGNKDFDLEEVVNIDIMSLRALRLDLMLEVASETELESYYNILLNNNNNNGNINLDIINKKIDSIYLKSIYSAYIKKTGKLDLALEAYKSGDLAHKMAALSSLGKSKNKDTYIKAMDLLLSKQQILLQDKVHLSFSLLSNLEHRDLFCSFFKDNFSKVVEIFNENSSNLSYIVESVISVCGNIEGAENIKGINMAIEKGLESFETKKEVYKRNIEYLNGINKN